MKRGFEDSARGAYTAAGGGQRRRGRERGWEGEGNSGRPLLEERVVLGEETKEWQARHDGAKKTHKHTSKEDFTAHPLGCNRV